MEAAGQRNKDRQVNYQDPDVVDVDEDYDDDHDRPKRRRSYRQPSRRLRSSNPESSGEDVIAAQPRSGRAPPRTRQHRFRHTREEEEAVIKIVHPLNEVAPHLPMSIDKPEKPFSRPVVDHYGEFPDDDFQVQLDLRTPRDPSLPKREFHEHDYIIYLRKPENWDTLTNLEQWRIKRDTLENKYGKGRFIFWGSADFMGDVGAPPNQIMVRHVFARFEVVRRFEPSDIADFWENSKDRLAFLESCDELNHVEIEFSKDALLDYEKSKHYELPEDENEEERIRRAHRYTPAGIRKSNEHYAQVRAAQDAAIDERDRLNPRGPPLKWLRARIAENDVRDRAIEAKNREREQWLRDNPCVPEVAAPVIVSEADIAAEQVEHEKRRMQAFTENHFQAYDSLMNVADAENADPLVVASQPIDWQEVGQPAPALTESASDSDEDVYAVTASGRAELMRMAQMRAEFDQLQSKVNEQLMGVDEMMEEFGQLEPEVNEQQEDTDQIAEAVGPSEQEFIQQPESTEQDADALAPADLDEELPVIPTKNSLSGLEKVSPGLLSGLSGFNLAAFVPEVLQHADSTQGDPVPTASQHEVYEDDDADADGEEDTTGDHPSAQPPLATEVSATMPDVADASEPHSAVSTKRKRALDCEDDYDDDEEDGNNEEHTHNHKRPRLDLEPEQPVAATTIATSVPSEVDPVPIASTSAPNVKQQQPQSPRLPIEKLIAQVGRESRLRHEENLKAARLSARVTNDGEALNVTASAAAAGSLLSQLGTARQASNPPVASNTTTTTTATASVPSQPSAVPDTTNVTPANITTPAATVTPAATATPVPSQPTTIPDTSAVPGSVTATIPAPETLAVDVGSNLFNVDSNLGKRGRDEYDVSADFLDHIKHLKGSPLDDATAPAPPSVAPIPAVSVSAFLVPTVPTAPVASISSAPAIASVSAPELTPANAAPAFYTTESTLGKRGRDEDVQSGSEQQIDQVKRVKVNAYSQAAQKEATASSSASVAPSTTPQRVVRGSEFLDVDSLPATDDLPAVTAGEDVYPIAELLGPIGRTTSEGKHVSILHKLDPDQGTMRVKYQQGLRHNLINLYGGESASPAELEHLLMVDHEFDDHMSTYREKRKVILQLIFDYFRDRYDAQHDNDDIERRAIATWKTRLQGSIVDNMKKVPIKVSDFRGNDQLSNCHLAQYYKHLAWEAELSMDKRDSGDQKQPLWLAYQLRAAMAAAMAKQLKWLDFAYLQVAKQWQERKQARTQAAGMVPAQAQPLEVTANAHGQFQSSKLA